MDAVLVLAHLLTREEVIFLGAMVTVCGLCTGEGGQFYARLKGVHYGREFRLVIVTPD